MIGKIRFDKGPQEVLRALFTGTPEQRQEALEFQWESFHARYGCYPNELVPVDADEPGADLPETAV